MVSAARLSVEFDSKGVSGVKNDISGIGSALDSANGKGQSFFSTMMGTAGGFLLAGGLTKIKDSVLGVGSSIIDANSNMEMWTMQLAVSTGSMENANSVIKDMTTMAKISPFDLPELIQGANALESLGFSSQKWMTVIGDTAAGTNKSVDQVVQAMMDASTGEFERLKELGIRTSVQGDKIQFSFMKNGQMMVIEAENTSEGIENALFGIWDDKYGGAMETMSDTWKGRMGNLQDTINMGLLNFGKPLFDAAKEGVLGLTTFLETFIGRVEQGQGILHSLLWSIPETLRNMGLGDLANTITPAIKGIETAWNRVGRVGRTVGRIIKTTLGAAFEFLGDHMDVVAAVGKSLLTVFAVMFTWGAIGAIISGIGAAITLLLGPVALAIAAVAALYLAWDNNWFGIQEKTAIAWAAIKPIFDYIKEAVQWIADGFELGGWEEAWSRIQTVASDAWGHIKDALSDVDWSGIWDGISSAASSAWGAISDTISGVWSWLSGLDWGQMLRDAWGALSGAAQWIVDALGSAASAISGWVFDQFNEVDWPGVVTTGIAALSSFGTWIVETFGDIKSAISAWFGEQFAGVDWVSSVRGGISSLAEAIGTAVGSMAGILTELYTWVTEQINKVNWSGIGQDIGKHLGNAIKAAIGLLLMSADLYIKISQELADIDWGSLAEALWEYLKAAALAALHLLEGIGQGLFDSLFGEVGGIDWGGLWEPIFQPFEDGFNAIIGFAEDRINDLIGLYNMIPGLPDLDKVGGDSEGGATRTTHTPKYEGQTTQTDRNNSPAFQDMRSMFGIGQMLKEARDGSDLFKNSLDSLNPSILASNQNLQLTASTVPMYTSSTKDATGATGSMATSVGASFGSIAMQAATKFAAMRNSAVSLSSEMQSTTSSNVSSMASTAGLRISAMQMAAGLSFRSMAGDAKTSGTEMGSGMTAWMLGAQLNIAAGLLVMVRSIRNVGSSGYDAGYYAGSQISLGFANGMLAYLGQINTAASLMVAAASRAVIAKAMISSPSRLFKQYGEYIGAGMEEGILGKVRDVGRASERMIGAALWTPETPSFAGAGATAQAPTVVNNYYTISNQLASPELIRVIDGSNKGHEVAQHLSGNRNQGGFERGVR